MNLITQSSSSYSLLDSGDERRLERFGNNIVIRSDNTCLWTPEKASNRWALANATYNRKSNGKFVWDIAKELVMPWQSDFLINNKNIAMSLRLGPSKNIGVFPEQQANWTWIAEQVSQRPNLKLLNLFGYTGGASLVAASLGAEVCHVDASKAVITWAKNNQILSGLEASPIRWIEDDCVGFMKREIKRGMKYDAIIMDPPAFGRDPKGKSFLFEDQIHELIKSARDLLSDQPKFLLLNSYAMSYPPKVMGNLLREYFPKQEIHYGNLQIEQEKSARILSCAVYGRVNF